MEEDIAYRQFICALRVTISEKGYGGMTAVAIDSKISQGFISQILKPNSKKKAGFKAQVSLAKACGYSYEEFLVLGKKLINEKETPDSQKKSSDTDLTKEAPKQEVKVGKKMDQEAKELLQHYKEELNALRSEIDYLRKRNRELEEQKKCVETPSQGEPEKKTAV